MSSSEEAEFDGDEDMPLASLKTTNGNKKAAMDGDDESPRKKRASKGAVCYAADDDDDSDDSEEDVPLAALKESPNKKKNGNKKKITPAKKKAKTTTTTKKKAPSTAASKSSSSSSDDLNLASFALYGSGCDKGKLIQILLCRWWYAITWPDPATLPEKPPKRYDALDGFPGVYVCTEGDEVGALQDLRDKTKAPSFNNLAKKESEELRTLLLKACEEQKRQLMKHDGEGTDTEKELKGIIKWATKLNPKKADKEAEKVLKAKKLTLT